MQINAGAYACGWKFAPLIFIGTMISAVVSVSPKSVLQTCTGTMIHAAVFACPSFALQDTGLTPILANVSAWCRFARMASCGTVNIVNACVLKPFFARLVLSGVKKNAPVSAFHIFARLDSTSTALFAIVFAFLKIAKMGLPGTKLNVLASACQRFVQLASILTGIFANAIANQNHVKLHRFGIVTSAHVFVHPKIACQDSTGTKLTAPASVFLKNAHQVSSGMI
jgi:hypothetical protein